MERRVDLSRVKRAAADSAKLFVKDVRSKLKKGARALFGFKTWNEFQKAITKARLNDYRKRHGRSCYKPHTGDQQLARAQRRGAPAWYAWKNELR